jgi:hypothetical protein
MEYVASIISDIVIAIVTKVLFATCTKVKRSFMEQLFQHQMEFQVL